VREAGLEPARA